MVTLPSDLLVVRGGGGIEVGAVSDLTTLTKLVNAFAGSDVCFDSWGGLVAVGFAITGFFQYEVEKGLMGALMFSGNHVSQ